MRCTERNFIRRLKKKKEDALAYIMTHYGGLIHGIAYQILGSINQQTVDECVNDVFLLIWQRAAQFEGDATDFKKWVGTMTKYKAIDYYRVLEKQKEREQSDAPFTATQAGPDLLFLEKERRQALFAIISHLPAPDCDIFMMKYILSMSSHEIAEALQLSVTAIDNRLSRGRKKLAQNEQVKELFI